MIGERIQRARRLRGLSLEALAQRMGDITKQALSKFEKGDAVPNSARLLQLARTLEVKPEYFFRPDTFELAPVEFRKLSGMSARDQESVIEQARDHLERYLTLEQCFEAAEVAVQPFPAESLPVSAPEEAELAAEKLRDAWCLGSDAISNLTELLEEHGIKVVMLDGIDQFDGACVATQDKQHVLVALNRQRPGDRQRFTAAHELGHWVMALPADMPEKEKEACCHRFAAALLYPQQRVRTDFGSARRHRVLIQELMLAKRGYGISMQVAMRRLKELGLISDSLFRSLSAEMTKRGWSILEPEPMSPENPLRFTSLVYWGLAEGLFTESRAAEFLQQPVSALEVGACVTLEA
jgi:Zn-dependent peptidase ImmA (M78 family)/DNA-binding XRE family transcriptional regulator